MLLLFKYWSNQYDIEYYKKNGYVMVLRKCDDCGEERLTTIQTILLGILNRGVDKDYCKKCSYKHRIMNPVRGTKCHNWNGGHSMTENGYYRISFGEHQGEYEHKVILSKHLGRELTTEEKVHHIDLNKINNEIKNLYVCKNKTEHWECHQSMEDCGFILFNKYIFFNFENKRYTTKFSNKCTPSNNAIDISDIVSIKSYKEIRRIGGKPYLRPTNFRKNGKTTIHAMVAERMIGRKIFANETVHHVDGDTLNNDISNLIVITRSEHKLCHYSLQDCVIELFKNGIIEFKDGKYFKKEAI